MLKFLKHIFIPHESNGHRPKILHHQTISMFIIVLLSLIYIIPPLKAEYPSVLGISYNITVNDLVNLTNQKRQEAGLKPLVLNSQLSSAASAKASYMLEKNYWAHIAPDGTTPWYFIKNAGYEYQYAGENLARGFSTSEEVTNAWMASPTHRDNLLSANYTDIGFAVVQGNLTGSETVLIVQEFGSKYAPETEEVAAAAESIDISPTSIPEVTVQIAQTPSSESTQTFVAASINKPLVDVKTSSFNLSAFLLGVFIVILLLDAIIIERKRISRIVAHNLDHIIFLTILLIAVIIISSGVVI